MAQYTVLVAAQSPLFSRSLVRMASQGGHDVVLAGDSAEVVSLVAQGKTDLCFVQDELPGGTGVDCCAELAGRSQGRQVPVILFSRRAELEDEALAGGASGFLRVPCQTQEVLGLIERWGKIAPASPEPVARPEPPAPSPAAAPPAKAVGTGDKRPRILLVDDSKLIHTYVQKIFTGGPYDLLQAYDGVEGFDAVCAHLPDLVISDIDMPNMNGFDMCKKVKEHPPTEHIPILILSARGAGVDIDRGFDVGANDYLTKPVDENELFSRVDMVLKKRDEEKREKILVVEDSKVQRNLVVQCLEQQGFDIVAAEDGKQGLEKAVEWLPDLVITDSEMPLMNGRDLTRELKKKDELRDVPVLMLTAADSQLDRTKGRHAGVSAYLAKPFVPDKVVVIAEKLIAERRLIRERRAMHLYLSDSAAQAAAQAAQAVGEVDEIMRAEARQATVFFTDIVGFTTMTERMDPVELVTLLNGYFDVMAPLFRENGGIIDKFVGDAIMAVFTGEDAEGQAEAAYNAVKTGVGMLENLKTFNSGRTETINVRVGINTGQVIMGDIGSKLYRRDYTVIGDSVNLAARLESSAAHGTVQISDSTYSLISDRVEVKELGGITVKGKTEPTITYEVQGLFE